MSERPVAAVELYPAIDIAEGRAVRLVQGDFGRRTDYGDPVEAATRLAAEGPPWLHVVDLDAARSGSPVNRDVVAAIARAVSVPVQAGGGVRDEAA
ncbi:MAG: bifunctional 1-(5-phosphoribosyl)-5-((5-phosphoribosylamino)methylideneamino)imidazole-4-carboxamide isomerase/phosphoribosylanthranilate isomerase PriA, partial [Acidimicrobiales bacterium]|nr:bifunctional 1-(5-phosphoribosyl)-5-((5-phosphoribosylamino)methylideneamino)imidazole-4-carboxamide isomerase/phosphoribosylanthranilate isomerase PriA [Acidimicrobiales bacterium]